MKRKSKGRIFRGVLVVLFLFLFLGGSFSIVSKESMANSEAFIEAEHKNNSYIEVLVKKGDTIWHLAKKYNESKKDIRQVIYEIRKINNLSNVNIVPGQIILIPRF